MTLRVVEFARIAEKRRRHPDAFVDEMMRVQEAVRACEREHDIFDEQWACAMRAEVIRALDETQFFWYIPLAELSRVTFIFKEDAPAQFQPYDEAASNSSALSAINLGSLSGSNLIRRNPRRVRDITSPVSPCPPTPWLAKARQWKRATLLKHRRRNQLTARVVPHDDGASIRPSPAIRLRTARGGGPVAQRRSTRRCSMSGARRSTAQSRVPFAGASQVRRTRERVVIPGARSARDAVRQHRRFHKVFARD